MTPFLQYLPEIIVAAFAAWGVGGMIHMIVDIRKTTRIKRRTNEVMEFRIFCHALFEDSIIKLPSANEMILDNQPVYKYLGVFLKQVPAEEKIIIPRVVNDKIKSLIEENKNEDALLCIFSLAEKLSEARAHELLNAYLVMAGKQPWTVEDFEISKQLLFLRGLIVNANNG